MDFPIVVLISGRGSNMVNLADNAHHFTVVAVVSDKADAPGLAAAAQRGIKTIAVPRKDFPSVAEQKQEIFRVVRELNPKLVALAGFMKLIEPSFITELHGQVINIHPSLLPKFPGLDTHQRALDAQEKEHGCSVHFVDSGVDTGSIVAQASVPIHPGDNAQVLADRVLAREHSLYPWAVNNLALGKITLEGRKVLYAPELRAEASNFDFKIPSL